MKIILDDLKVKYEGLMKLFCNNNSTISIVHNPIQHNRTKYIEIDKHFIKDKLGSRLIVKAHVPTRFQALGDLMESCVGAILLDSGFNLNTVWKIMTSFLDPIMKFSSSLQLSPVRDLRELCQSHNLELEFLSIPSKLPKMFSIEAKMSGKGVCETASAIGQNKKEASRIASQLLFSKLKAQGWKAKSKTLEEVLQSTTKMEPKLIAFDETPIDITDTTNTARHIMVNADLYNKAGPEIRPIQETLEICSPCVKPVGQWFKSSAKGKLNQILENRDCSSDSSGTGTARSRLYEFCAAYCWKPPLFECCKEEGPDHLKQFTCKVTLEIEEAPDVILEFVGEPQSKKKDAAESAAEGAFWYLQQEEYIFSVWIIIISLTRHAKTILKAETIILEKTLKN
ncbi:Dicer-like protein 4, partial [Mucuna pruriens]